MANTQFSSVALSGVLLSFAGCAFWQSTATARESSPATRGCWITSVTGVCGSGLTASPNRINCGGAEFPEFRWSKPDIKACVSVQNGYNNCYAVSVSAICFRAYCDPNNPGQVLEEVFDTSESCDSVQRGNKICGDLQGPPLPLVAP